MGRNLRQRLVNSEKRTAARANALPADWHRATASELIRFRRALMRYLGDVQGSIPVTHPVNRHLKATLDKLDGLRCWLDSLFAETHPKEFGPKVYYPGD